MDTDQLQICLKDRESQVAALEDELKKLRDNIELGKSTQAVSTNVLINVMASNAAHALNSILKDS